MPDYAASVQAVALRITRLTATGAPATGATAAYVTKAFTRFSFTPEYTEGEEIEVKAADGSTCVYYKVPDVLKRVNFELAICHAEPEVYELLAGGALLQTAEATPVTVGWASPGAGDNVEGNGVSIEAWSRAIVNGRPAPTNPYFRWLIPWGKTRMAGERVLENGAMANAFEGYGLDNENWGDGPTGDWTFPTSQPFAFARTSTLPTGEGYVTVA